MRAPLYFVPKSGDRLKNGAIIIDCKKAWDEVGYVALCLWTEDWQGTEPEYRHADPYVTWKLYPKDHDMSAHNGHYFDQLSTALDDFNSRI